MGDYYNKSDHCDEDALISRRNAEVFLGLAPGVLAVWASTKRYPLPYVKIGRLAKYRLSDLRAFIDKNLMGSRHGE